MSSPLFSQHWYRVRNLMPHLANDVIATRQVLRNNTWWVLHRPSTSTHHRLDDESYRLLELLDGRTTVESVWEQSLERHGDEAASQSDLISLLAALYEAQLLTTDRKQSAEHLFAQREEQARKKRKERFLNPLYMRFFLFDPNALLDRTSRWWKPLTGTGAWIAWLALMASAAFVVSPLWPQLSREFAAFEPFAAHNVAIYLCLYPLIKLVHEFAHAMMVKRAGGEVHEMGVALMVLLPLPYVDASAASACPDKTTRISVSAAGILVELAASAIAAIIWATTAPGMLHDISLIVMLIGGISTLLFNGNPLLKFDGYFILADLLEIPNLSDRSRRYWLDLGKHRLFGLAPSQERYADRRERAWIATYGVLSTCYRVALMAGIAVALSDSYFFFGVLLAGWVAWTVLLRPLVSFGVFLQRTEVSSLHRVVVPAAIAAVAVIVGFTPTTSRVHAQGVVWLPDNAIIRAPYDCEVVAEIAQPDDLVQADASLFRCVNDDLQLDADVLQAQIDELQAELAASRLEDRVEEQKFRHRLESLSAKQQHTQTLLERLNVTAAHDGRYVLADSLRLHGRHLQEGDVVGYVIPPSNRSIRAALREEDANRLPAQQSSAQVRMQHAHGASVHSTRIIRRGPKASRDVPTRALTSFGGGEHLAAADGEGLTVRDPVINLELAWPEGASEIPVGSHVQVRIEGASLSLLQRFTDDLRRTFLGHQSS